MTTELEPTTKLVQDAKQTLNFKLKNIATTLLIKHVDFVGKIQTAANRWRKLIDETEAHDAATDALLQAIEKFNPTRGTFRALFSQIFRRKLISVIRHKTCLTQGYDRTRSLKSDDEEMFAPNEDMDINLDADTMRERLKAALSPYEYRLLELHGQGLTYKEITAATNAEFNFSHNTKSIGNSIFRISKGIAAICVGDDTGD